MVTKNAGPSQAATEINKANAVQSGQALIVQSYCISVNSQPDVIFASDSQLKQYQTSINEGLSTARSTATEYLNTILPKIYANISNIENYYTLHTTTPAILREGSSKEQWISLLTALQVQATSYQSDAEKVVSALSSFSKNVQVNLGFFNQTTSELNQAVNADKAAIDSLKWKLSSTRSQINKSMDNEIWSALGVVGGYFLICVGTLAEFATAGLSTSLVLGGVGMVVHGVGGVAGDADDQVALNQEQTDIIRSAHQLESESKLAVCLCEQYQSLYAQASNAITAAEQMRASWAFLVSDLDAMLGDLKAGRAGTDAVRKLFLAGAKSEGQMVLEDAKVIKGQMEGAGVVVAAPGDRDASPLPGETSKGSMKRALKKYNESGISKLIKQQNVSNPAASESLSSPAGATA